MLQHGLACWLIGRRIPIAAATFSYSEPPWGAEYRLMYSTQLQFNDPTTTLMFDRSFLDLHVIQNEATAKEFIRKTPANIVLKYKNEHSLTAQIRRRLRKVTLDQWPNFDDVADSLGMTTSTLRRRLESEGQSNNLDPRFRWDDKVLL